ncbi:DUF262 domain-containing protein [Flavobacterium undicola]|uniref:DUF262 domain-containing protein n=1 Tax=Flavobacterium undicola TaxID=1932779 RepID=UPI0013764D53|nr:DUF262 domain-containing protein [Flavobacterium undicola]MBA0884946.1 DUF262 domain-containing protein [Flavobacterium undicola]
MAYTNNEEHFLRVFKNSIKIDARTISVKTLLSERNLKRINYSPYYQRNYVWDLIKQTFFIESVILGTEIPPLIFFKSGLKIEVIDGRQRFETLKRFKDNEITLSRKGLMSLTGIDKQSFNKLDPEKLKEVFLESNIRIFEFEIINEPTLEISIEDKIKREIFRRYNTGITPLTSSEVDNARYNKDPLSDLFKKELALKGDFYTYVNNCFFNGEIDEKIQEKANYLRRLYIIEKFPISKYASGKERAEIVDLLYNFTTEHIENYITEFENFKSQIKLVHDFYLKISEEEVTLKNRFIFECIFWAIRILESEDRIIELDENYTILVTHYKKNIAKYIRDDSHYYSSIIDRFSDTAEVFQLITQFNFSIFIRNLGFKETVKNILSSEPDSVQKTDEFDHLRINKPSPISTPIDEIRSDIKTHRYSIRPSYQRQEKVSELKASSIIESILLGINLPPIFVLKKTDGVKEVIDGQQRLLSIMGFLGEQYMDQDGKLQYSKNNSYKLKGLKILKEHNGSNYNKLTEELREKILDFTIDVIIIDQNVNPNFEATDLFIRLNNKPYPIQPNSFEMWNSTVDTSLIKRIKEITKEHSSWFYSKETNSVEEERNDRMENEELLTILSYIKYNSINSEFEKILGFFTRKDRITCRIKNKAGLTDFLIKLDNEANEKEIFLECIENTNTLINKLKELFGGNPNKESLNSLFNVKGSAIFRRSFQDFYIMWVILVSYDSIEIEALDETFFENLKENLKTLRNTRNSNVEDNYLHSFVSELNLYYSL